MSEQCDLLVIGGGAAGLSAAVTAAQRGKSVTVLERSAITGGNGQFAEGVFAAGSALQRRNGIDADPGTLFRRAMEFSHWRADAALTRALIDGSGPTVDWLCSLGVPFSRVIHHMVNQTPEVFHMTAEPPTGKTVMAVLRARCAELGVKTETGVRVRTLLTHNGAVAGAETNERAYAAENVLIACGGMAGNPALLKKLRPGLDMEGVLHVKGIYHPGDGVALSEQAGGRIGRDIAIEGAGPVFCGRGPVGALVRCPEALWVNLLGERFADETVCEDFIFGWNAVARQPQKRCWALFDGGTVRRLMAGPPGIMQNPAVSDNGFGDLPEALDLALEQGHLFRADSFEELAEKTGLPPKTLGRTAQAYNAACTAGLDDRFGKERRYLAALTESPYYAAEAGLDMITTHGGVCVDSHMRVVDGRGNPIPGLYAAGVDISGVDSGDYSVRMSGHAFGFALTGGRLAAQNMS